MTRDAGAGASPRLDADGGDIPAARRSAARVARPAFGHSLQPVLDGYVLARGGDTTGACGVLQAMRRAGSLAQQALVYAALGDKDSMYVLFERAIDAREPDALWFLNAVPALRPLRPEPRYQALLERMGLPEELRR